MAEIFDHQTGHQPDPTLATSRTSPLTRWLPVLVILMMLAGIMIAVNRNGNMSNNQGVQTASQGNGTTAMGGTVR